MARAVMMRIALALLLVVTLARCGGVETAVVVEVDVSHYRVPGDVDELVFELADDGAVVTDRSFTPLAGERRASVTLVPSESNAGPFQLTVHGLLEGLPVAITDPIKIVFEPDRHPTVRLALHELD